MVALTSIGKSFFMNQVTSKIWQALHSRTVWSVIVLALFNVLPHSGLSPEFVDLINGILVAVTGYFHINPNSVYIPAGSTAVQTSPTVVTVTKYLS
jgi:hypothetical protein